MNIGLQVGLFLFALFCVLLNGFFVAAEFAMVRVRSTRLEELKTRGNPIAKISLDMVAKLDPYLSATQIGITMASLALGWLGEPAFAHWLQPFIAGFGIWSEVMAGTISLSCAFGLITLLHIVVGELVPKSLAIQKPEQTLMCVSLPMTLFYKAMFPLIATFNYMANLVIRSIGLRSAGESELAHSEEELRLILARAQRQGVIPPDERMMLDRVFDFGGRNVHQIMVPRSEIVYLSTQRSMAANIELARQQEHSRYPLCEQELDHVIGMVHLKDLLWRLPEVESLDLKSLQREILFVPQSQPIGQLMKEFQKRHILMAIVVDEYGGTSGLVTLEDILEELVGEIQDEFDEEAPKYYRQADGSFLIDGRLLILEAEKLLQVELSDRHNDTLGGHFLSLHGKRPKVGDTLNIGIYTARVIEMKGLRISKILFTPSPRQNTSETEKLV